MHIPLIYQLHFGESVLWLHGYTGNRHVYGVHCCTACSSNDGEQPKGPRWVTG